MIHGRTPVNSNKNQKLSDDELKEAESNEISDYQSGKGNYTVREKYNQSLSKALSKLKSQWVGSRYCNIWCK